MSNRFDRLEEPEEESGTLCVEPHDKWAALMIAHWLKREERRLAASSAGRCKLQACALESFREKLEEAAELPPTQDVINAGLS